jgi:hypothetical protein
MISAELETKRKLAIALTDAKLRLFRPEYGTRQAGQPAISDLSNPGGISHGAGYKKQEQKQLRVDEREVKYATFFDREKTIHMQCKKCGRVSCDCGLDSQGRELGSSMPIPEKCKATLARIEALSQEPTELGITLRLSGPSQDGLRPDLYPSPKHCALSEANEIAWTTDRIRERLLRRAVEVKDVRVKDAKGREQVLAGEDIAHRLAWLNANLLRTRAPQPPCRKSEETESAVPHVNVRLNVDKTIPPLSEWLREVNRREPLEEIKKPCSKITVFRTQKSA